MAAIVLLTDRFAQEALPALASSRSDLKVEPLSVASLVDVLAFSPEVVLVDAADNPGQGHAVLRALRERGARVPAAAS